MKKKNGNPLTDEQMELLAGPRSAREVLRNLRNYLAGQHIGATRDDSLLDEVLKCLFCKLYIEMGQTPQVPSGLDAFEMSKAIRRVFQQVRADFPDLYDEASEILLDPESVAVVFRECQFSLLDATSDPIGDAFEVFVGSESKSRSGQFFTPRPVTELLVKALDPKPGETIVDPACGAGGFLSSVTRHFLENGLSPKRLAGVAAETLFGVDKDEYLVKLAKLHISLLTGGHPRVVCGDSIALTNGGGTPLKEIQEGQFDVLLTNPPFGVHIVAAKPEILRKFELARKWRLESGTDRWGATSEVQTQVPPQILFVERCLSLLKQGGRLGMVLPESVLSNKSYRHVVQYIFDHSEVQAVIGMPESLFKTSGKGGTHTKTCLLVATKREKGSRSAENIFMAEAKWCGHDSRARAIPHNDLPEIAENLKRFRKKQLKRQSPLGFFTKNADIQSNVLCPRYYDPLLAVELEALAETHELHVFGDLLKQGVLSVSTGDELGKLAYGTGTIPFIRTSDISNWELKADPKHGVDRKIYDKLKLKQDVQESDIFMVKDGTYLVGTCAMISAADREILYQSHLYKIRVNRNEIGLTPELLLVLLSSAVVQRQIRAKQFTQDIIDSLGERIRELVLPIPKDPNIRQDVSELVRRSIALRVQAKELVKSARAAVHRLDEIES